MLKMREKQALTAQIVKRYLKATKREKGLMLSEFIENTGYNRSYARRVIRLARDYDFRRKHKIARTRPRDYDQSFLPHLVDLWRMSYFMCGKRLAPIIPEYVVSLERDKMRTYSPEIRGKLLSISASTIDRLLTVERKKQTIKGRSLTKPGTLLKHQIPIRTWSEWDDTRPGYFETDTVAFGGSSPAGHFVWGLDLVDVATGWVLLDAVMGKGQERIHQAIDDAKHRLVYRILGLDSDSGAEFINDILLRYCDSHHITFTRTRPGRKNDNCFVEQKNYTTLRAFLGYGRYETEEQLAIIKAILRLVEIYTNFFQASVKLKNKERFGAKVVKHHDQAITPYKRLCRSGMLSGRQRKLLANVYHSHNPLELMVKITKLQEELRLISSVTI